MLLPNTRSLSEIWFAKIFPHSVNCLFTFFMVVFKEYTFFNFMKSSLFIFLLSPCNFGCIFRKPLPNVSLQRLTPMSTSKSFILLGLIFRSLVHFELILVGVLLHSVLCDYPITQHHSLKWLLFSYWIVLSSSSNIIWL